MFREFLLQYIQDLIECSSDAFCISQKDIQDVASNIENSERVWNYIDEAIYEEIDKYRLEGEQFENNN